MSKFKLYPYCEIDGFNTFRDSEIKELYFRMIADGEDLYRDNVIANGDDFLRHMKYESALYVGYLDDEIVGFIYLDNFKVKTAWAHFCLFKEFRGIKENIAFCKTAIDTILSTKTVNKSFMYDVLMGMIPSDNKQAIAFVKKLDWVVLGEIPAAMWDAKAQESMAGTIIYFNRS